VENSENKDIEFDVLGFKIKFRHEEDGESNIAVSDVIACVSNEAKNLRDQHSNLKSGEIAILVALKMAEQKLSLEKEYQENIDKLQVTAKDALGYIEQVSPSRT
jgi:hypothetical protein